MFEAKEDEIGYVIPVEYIHDKFAKERFTSISTLVDIDVTASVDNIASKADEYLSKGAYANAIKEYDRLLIEIPRILDRKGFALHSLMLYDEAIECYDKALQIEPNLAFIWNNKGIALHNLKKYGDAIKCYDRAIEIDPSYTYAWLSKGRVLDVLGRHKEARRCFKRAKLSNL